MVSRGMDVLPYFSVLLSVINDEELIRLRHRLKKLDIPDAAQWAQILSDELAEREAMAKLAYERH